MEQCWQRASLDTGLELRVNESKTAFLEMNKYNIMNIGALNG